MEQPLTGSRLKTIMLVEDEPSIRRLVGTALRRGGYQVLEAANGLEAIDSFAAHQDEVDLLITDVRMPQMAGPELIRRLRASKPDLKVLCISGCIASVTAEIGEEVTLLQKPFTGQDLLKQVGRIVD